MAVVATTSNHYKYMLATKQIDLVNDSIKAILMNDSFAFDKDAHATLADVTADQLATANGYTQNNKALSNKAVAESDVLDQGVMSCDPITWTASTGAIGPTGALILYDDTTADDTVIGCIDFGTDYTIPDGQSLQFTDITIPIS